jgi:hypothetical protein
VIDAASAAIAARYGPVAVVAVIGGRSHESESKAKPEVVRGTRVCVCAAARLLRATRRCAPPAHRSLLRTSCALLAAALYSAAPAPSQLPGTGGAGCVVRAFGCLELRWR